MQPISLHLYLLQPIISEDEEVVVCVEGLQPPPEKLAMLYPGCSQDSRVIVDVAESSLFNATVVRQLSDLNGVKLFMWLCKQNYHHSTKLYL